jgi:hypothetical protein
MSAWTVIAHRELSSAQAEIEFTSIPQTFTDLVLVLSLRTTTGTAWSDGKLEFNGVTTGYTARTLYGNGSTVPTPLSETVLNIRVSSNANTANTFGNQMIYIPNYTGSAQKSVSIDQVTENNATQALQALYAGQSDITSAISSLKVTATSGTSYAINSSATLYGILRGSSGGVVVS